MGRGSTAGGARGGSSSGAAGSNALTSDWQSVSDGVELRSLSPPGEGQATQFDTVEIKIDGKLAGRMAYSLRADGVAEIDDTVINDAFRGRGTIPKIFPRFVRHLKTLGAKRIVAKVVDEDVGLKVWQREGFKPRAPFVAGRQQTWVKELD